MKAQIYIESNCVILEFDSAESGERERRCFENRGSSVYEIGNYGVDYQVCEFLKHRGHTLTAYGVADLLEVVRRERCHETRLMLSARDR